MNKPIAVLYMASAMPFERSVLLVLRLGERHRLEDRDERADGAQQPEERRDVGQRPERADAHLDLGVTSIIVSSIACATAASPLCTRESPALATRATGAEVALAQLARAVEVVGRQESLDLLEEGLRVDVPPAKEVDRTLYDQGDDDRKADDVHDHERPALLMISSAYQSSSPPRSCDAST
jgi:hypothetical protein